MKTLLLIICLGFANTMFAQLSKNSVYSEFQLSSSDHRTVEFVTTDSSCTTSYSNMKDAIESVFTVTELRDYTRVCLSTSQNEYFNKPLTIDELVEIYVELKK